VLGEAAALPNDDTIADACSPNRLAIPQLPALACDWCGERTRDPPELTRGLWPGLPQNR